MRRSFVIRMTVFLAILLTLSGCAKRIEEAIPTVAPVVTESPTPSPTASPTPSPRTVVQGSYQLYFQAERSDPPILIVPRGTEDDPMLFRSDAPGRLTLMQGDETLWEETLETFPEAAPQATQTPEPAKEEGWAQEDDGEADGDGPYAPQPYGRWSFQRMESDSLALMTFTTDEVLVFSDNHRACRHVSLRTGDHTLYNVGLDEAHERLIYPDDRQRVLMSRPWDTQEEALFFDPEIFYQVDSYTALLPEDDLALTYATEQIHDRVGYLLSRISDGQKLGFLPEEGTNLMRIPSDEGIYFESVGDNFTSYYRWDWEAGRLVPLIQCHSVAEQLSFCRVAQHRLFRAMLVERECLTEVYDLETRACLHRGSMDPSLYMLDGFWDDWMIDIPVGDDPLDFWLTLSEPGGELALFRVQYGQDDGLGTAAQPMPGPLVQPILEVKDYGEFSRQAEALNEKYGVTILLGENALFFDNIYAAEALQSDEEIRSSLELIEHALSAYPEGFFREFTQDGFLRYFYIGLAGKIQRKSADAGIPDVVGFANADTDRQFICLDTKYDVEGTFYHEVSHAIDSRIAEMTDKEGRSLLDEEAWNAMNPEGYQYYDAYLDDEGNAMETVDDGAWTYAFERKARNAYFIDSYSKTFATEDRARIMEYAAQGLDYPFRQSSHLAEKLRWYSRLIRQIWDDSTWPDKTPWEASLPD